MPVGYRQLDLTRHAPPFHRRVWYAFSATLPLRPPSWLCPIERWPGFGRLWCCRWRPRWVGRRITPKFSIRAPVGPIQSQGTFRPCTSGRWQPTRYSTTACSEIGLNFSQVRCGWSGSGTLWSISIFTFFQTLFQASSPQSGSFFMEFSPPTNYISLYAQLLMETGCVYGFWNKNFYQKLLTFSPTGV